MFVHAFDDPQIIAGAGTVGIEMLEDAPDLDVITVPIGGGGLMSGVSIAARALKPDIELIGVEAELYPSMKCAIQECQMPLGGDTLAEGIAVKQPGELTSRILREYANDVVLVSERDLERAVAMLVWHREDGGRGSRERPASRRCSPSPSATRVRRSRHFFAAAISTRTCSRTCWSAISSGKGASRAFTSRSHDQPGALAAITAKVYEAGVNVLEINHSRIFTSLPAKDTMIEVECEARDPQSIDDVVARLEAAGFRVERAQLD